MIDSHVNLHHEAFAQDLPNVLERAQAAGVHAMLTISDKIENTAAIEAIANAHPHIWRSVGAHPHYASTHLDLTAAQLVALAQRDKVIGIGETGLDFHYSYSSKEEQIPVFLEHVKAAYEAQLPLIVHTREADDLMADLLEAQTTELGRFPILLHCYTSGPELLERALALGAFVSFSGIATFKNAIAVREAVKMVPLDRVLIETDCPYLAPIPMRGRRNEPAFVTHVCAFLAGLYGIEEQNFADQADANFHALFARAA